MYFIEKLKRKNSRKFSPVLSLPTIDDVIIYIKNNNLAYAGSPYFFTHCKLSDGSIVTQKDDHFGITCSPEKLRERLETNNQ